MDSAEILYLSSNTVASRVAHRAAGRPQVMDVCFCHHYLDYRESRFLKKKQKSTPKSFVVAEKNAVRPANEQTTEFQLTLRNVGQPEAMMESVPLVNSR